VLPARTIQELSFDTTLSTEDHAPSWLDAGGGGGHMNNNDL